jgi:ketosteroid isomerase-like protein
MTDVASTADPTPDATGDTAEIWELHRAFVLANVTAHHPFLQQHMASGDTLVWYNLNQSNYLGVDHIVELWKMLAAAMDGRPARFTARDDEVTVVGDMALVTYLGDLYADFGELGTFEQVGRSTEVWRRTDGEWKMIHFHCSNHVPGVMGGK